MPLFPVRRFFQGATTIEAPRTQLGSVQWVLTRATYRFQTFDLAQVPEKNRTHALRLQLAQWTPFAKTGYYIGIHGQQALVWAWDEDKVHAAILAQGRKPQRTRILPESALQKPYQDGLCLTRCHEGFEGQLWSANLLERSRWWAQVPTQEEWLMFQRDAGVTADEQQSQAPGPRLNPMQTEPWVSESASFSDTASQVERLLIAMVLLLLLIPTFWYGFSLYKLQISTAQMQEQQASVQAAATPNTQARSQALSYRERADSLAALDPYPSQLSLMAKIAEILPKDKSYLKNWDFQQGQLKITIASTSDISTTSLISALQQVGLFRDVKALPGPDTKVVTFEMSVSAN